jgi:hypothetical protein
MTTPKAANGPRYPAIEISTAGSGASRLVLLGAILSAMNRAGVPPEEVGEFQREVNARPETYGDLLTVARRWVTVRQSTC